MNKTLLLLGSFVAIAALAFPFIVQVQDVFASGNDEEEGNDNGKGSPRHGKKACGRGQAGSNNPHCK